MSGARGRDVLVALGSSLGDRGAELAAARAELARFGELRACSEVLETPPWGASREPYLNQLVDVTSALLPWRFHERIKGFERARGRDPSRPINSARVLDIDMLLVRGVTMRSALLSLPHPRLWRRRFLHEVFATLPSADAWRPALARAGFWS